MALLLSIAYLPPISYFALMAKGLVLSADKVEPSVVYIEACENYQKQSWRNRCRFYASDGPQYLNFPIVHEGSHELPITQIKVDYKTGWIIRTERAIVSAYKTSAYFDYYKDELFSILDAHPETLFELDMDILRFFLAKTGIAAEIRLTNEYVQVASYAEALPTKYGLDYREILHPKRPDNVLDELGLKKPYFQVFAQKYGFVTNLSIMDLLFNEGPDSILYLKNI
ncbi:MAG: WbqC family protein [Bacteroidales bacterium]|nr:WbqC family protein [Bacteroidales bacterium]